MLAALAAVLLAAAPLPAGLFGYTDAPAVSMTAPKLVPTCGPFQVTVHVDNSGRPARDVEFRLSLFGGLAGVNTTQLREPTGQWVPFPDDILFGREGCRFGWRPAASPTIPSSSI